MTLVRLFFLMGAGTFINISLLYIERVFDVTDEEVIGGEQSIVTFGVHWYPVPNVRFMMNYVDVVDVKRPGNPVDGASPSVFTLRAQIDF